MSQKDGGGQDEEGENEKDEVIFSLRILISSHFPMEYLTSRLDQKQMHSHKNTDDLSDDGEYFEVRNKEYGYSLRA